jgi:hypothetical protein
MGSGNPDWLRSHTDEELLAIAADLQERAECFDAGTRLLVNDELRRRKLPTIGVGTSRH